MMFLMDMREKLESFNARYEKFLKSGGEDPLALKAEAKREGDCNVVKELEDILVDLTFVVEEMKCQCPMAGRCKC
jgi:chromosome condensin MukBEF MukE localization factor